MKHNIHFTGFCSQGDGASFSGRYRPVLNAVAAVKAEAPQDEELHRIATELTALQVHFKLTHGSTIQCAVAASGNHYSHSGTMSVSDVEFFDDGPHVIGDADEAGNGDALQTLLRDFADWIYKQLEAEYEYQTSDEVLAEQFAEGAHRFDEDGRII